MSHIAVRGAAEAPLRGVDVDLPLGQLVTLAGPAGSGARTMALQVLLAESRRRYLQALSPFEREAVGGVTGGVAVESVEGLPPAAVLPGPMPAAAAVSAFLHLEAPVAQLLRHRGRVRCPTCGGTCRSCSAEDGARWAVGEATGERGLVVAPVPLSGDASPESVASELRRAGFLRLRVGGEVVRLPEQLDGGALPTGAAAGGCLEVVVDRLSLSEGSLTRLAEAIRSARAMARGRAALFVGSAAEPLWLNQQLTCVSCGRTVAELAADELLPGGQTAQRHVTLAGRSVHEIHGFRLDGALAFWGEVLGPGADRPEEPTAGGAGRAILAPLEACCEIGLGYLYLDRTLGSLASGERLLLSVAAARSRDLSGILYLLSQPLATLDDEARAAALAGLYALTATANTVVAVAGDPETLDASDCVFHFSDGRLLAAEPVIEAAAERGGVPVAGPQERTFSLRGGLGWGNLQDLSLTVPLGCLVAFTGPTGAGKSALLEQLVPLVVGSRGRAPRQEVRRLRVDDGGLRRLVALGLPPAPSERDASILDLLDLAQHLAREYADTPAAAERGYPAEWFLLDRPGGRCTTCEGRGVLHWDLEFMEAMSLPCPACEGRRYRPEVLEVTQRGLAISDVLDLTLAEAAVHFERHRRLGPALKAAVRLALGHRRLGEGGGRLDPAELLRLSLAAALPRASSRDLFVLRYPAAGQHPDDVRHMLRGVGDLVAAGASVWVEDRHPDVLAAAATVVEVGPGRGEAGGRIVAVRGASDGVS